MLVFFTLVTKLELPLRATTKRYRSECPDS